MAQNVVRGWIALAALALATLTIGLDVTVLTVALPTLAVDLDAGTSALQWFSTAYTLVLAGAMLPAGSLGDRFGRKRLLVGALVVFGVASVACSFADSPGQLIAARGFLGLGAAVMIPLSIAVVPVLFSEATQRERAIAIWVAAAALGLPLGPILGGWLLNHFWWGSVFLINIPLVVIGAAAVIAFVPESRSSTRAPIDALGVVLSSAGLLCLTYGFIRAGQQGWGERVSTGALAVGLLVLAVFVVWQSRAANPLIDLGLFRSRGFVTGSVFVAVGMFTLYGLLFVLPQYFQAVLGADAFGSGLRLVPMMAGLIVGTKVADSLREARGARVVLIAGFVLLGVAGGLGATTSVDTAYWVTAMWTALVGAAMGFVMPTALGMAVGSVSVDKAGAGSAVIQVFRQVGGTIGAAVLPSVVAAGYASGLGEFDVAPIRDNVTVGVALGAGNPDMVARVQSSFVSGMALMLWLCMGMCVVSVLVASFLSPGRVPMVEASESVR
ncbi:DHA2 family efflux MFS transporter permease subunit [Nocardia lijiangensis]|uniref:DHA2 family efflux MFS transporter permease subunit n=1 Tax=Nocardia lijiangensis TaxID=299618 RepID=UPI003D71D1FF